MAKNIHISVSDMLHDELMREIDSRDITNKSMFIEELIRLGLSQYLFKKGDTNGNSSYT